MRLRVEHLTTFDIRVRVDVDSQCEGVGLIPHDQTRCSRMMRFIHLDEKEDYKRVNGLQLGIQSYTCHGWERQNYRTVTCAIAASR